MRSVLQTLQDNSPPYSRWPEAELVVYANYAQRALAKYLPQAGSRVDAIRLTPGTKQDFTKVLAANIAPGDGSTAADTYGIEVLDFTRNMGADGLTPGRAIRATDRYAKDTADPDWNLASKATEVVREWLSDKALPRVAYVAPPIPASPAVWVEVAWCAEPTRIPAGGEPGSELYLFSGASTQLMGVQDQFIDDAHNYVVAMALLKGSKNVQNLPKSQLHAAAFVTSINAQAAATSGVNPKLKMLPFAEQVQAQT